MTCIILVNGHMHWDLRFRFELDLLAFIGDDASIDSCDYLGITLGTMLAVCRYALGGYTWV